MDPYRKVSPFSVKAEVSKTTQRLPSVLKSTVFLMSRLHPAGLKSFKPLQAAIKIPPTIVKVK